MEVIIDPPWTKKYYLQWGRLFLAPVSCILETCKNSRRCVARCSGCCCVVIARFVIIAFQLHIQE